MTFPHLLGPDCENPNQCVQNLAQNVYNLEKKREDFLIMSLHEIRHIMTHFKPEDKERASERINQIKEEAKKQSRKDHEDWQAAVRRSNKAPFN